MEFDLLSSIFMRMRLKASIQNVFDAGGRWAIEVPVHRGIKIHTILKGRCWISLADDPTPRELVEGDCYLLPRGNAFLMSSDPTGSVAEIAPAMVLRRNEGITSSMGEAIFWGMAYSSTSRVPSRISSSSPCHRSSSCPERRVRPRNSRST